MRKLLLVILGRKYLECVKKKENLLAAILEGDKNQI